MPLKPFGSTLLRKCWAMSAQIACTRSGALTSTAMRTRGAREVVLVEIGQIPGEVAVRLIDGALVDVQLDQPGLEVQRQRGAVADRVLEPVAAHVAVLVLVRAERVERVPVAPVDGRAGQAEQEGVRQGLAHLPAEVALLGAVRLVHHRDDVGPRRSACRPPRRTCGSS